MEKVSGLPLLAAFKTAGGRGKLPGRIVLLRKNAREYVCAWQDQREHGGFATEGWHNGGYGSYEDMVAEFATRVRDATCENPSQAAFVNAWGHYLCPDCWHDVGSSYCCLVFQDVKCRDCHAVSDGRGGWREPTTVEDMGRSVDDG